MRIKSSSSRRVSLALLAAAALVARSAPVRTAQAPAVPAAAAAEKAEADLQFDAAAAKLYRIIEEDPRAADVPALRLRLARLLAITGETGRALLQAQQAKEQGADPLRAEATNLTTLLARRLRATAVFLPASTALPVRGLPSLDSPSAIDIHGNESLVADEGAGRAFRISGDVATPLPNVPDLSAAAYLPDGGIVSSGKQGLAIGATTFSGTWGGKPRQVHKVRAIAAVGPDELVIVDRDYDGVLRCQVAKASCVPWGVPGKARTVKVGASGFVYVLDDHEEAVRVLDRNGRPVAAVGGQGSQKLNAIDIAVDSAHGLYVLDRQTRRVEAYLLRSTGAGALSIVPLAGAAVRQDLVKNPAALGITADGSVLVAGRGEPRLVKLQ
jgi:hypothetical protein